MKTYKIIIACAASLFLGACSNELDEDVTLGVNIDTNENVQFRRTYHYRKEMDSRHVQPYRRTPTS